MKRKGASGRGGLSLWQEFTNYALLNIYATSGITAIQFAAGVEFWQSLQSSAVWTVALTSMWSATGIVWPEQSSVKIETVSRSIKTNFNYALDTLPTASKRPKKPLKPTEPTFGSLEHRHGLRVVKNGKVVVSTSQFKKLISQAIAYQCKSKKKEIPGVSGWRQRGWLFEEQVAPVLELLEKKGVLVGRRNGFSGRIACKSVAEVMYYLLD